VFALGAKQPQKLWLLIVIIRIFFCKNMPFEAEINPLQAKKTAT
jgi:hypothetical protein